MSENKKIVNLNVSDQETAFDASKSKLGTEYLLMKIEEISANQALLTNTVTQLGSLKSIGPGDVGMQEQAKALGTIIKSREATNQKLISLYEKMYDDIVTKDMPIKERAIRLLEKVCDDEAKTASVSELLNNILHSS